MNLLTLQPYYKVIADAQSRALDGTCYVVRGCAPTANGTGLRVDVSAGDSVEGGTPHVGYAGGNVTCAAAPATPKYRRDIVYRSSAGTLTVATGTSALLTSTTPVPPALPASATLIAVVFIAPGQTVLVATDVEDCRQVRRDGQGGTNVKTFGATGDGVTDDTAAIQAAVNAVAAAGGIVFIPEGNYKLAGTLTVPANVASGGAIILRGAGRERTVLTQTTLSVPSIATAAAAVIQQMMTIEDMTVTLTGTATSGSNGIHIIGANKAGVVLSRVWVKNHYNGIVLQDVVQATVSDANSTGNTNDGVQIIGSAPSTTVVMRNVYSTSNTRYGFHIDGLIAGTIEGGISELNGDHNWHLLGGADYALMNPYSESATAGKDHIHIDSSQRLTIVSPRTNGASGRTGLFLDNAGGTRPKDIVVVGGTLGGSTGYGLDANLGSAPVVLIGTNVGTGGTGRINDPGIVSFLGDDTLDNVMFNVWTDISPALTCTQSVAVTLTTQYARYAVMGRVVHVQAQLSLTSGGTISNAIVVGNLPAAIAPKQTGARRLCGTFLYLRSGVAFYAGAVEATTSSTLSLYRDADADKLGTAGGTNFAAANGDEVTLDLTYERA